MLVSVTAGPKSMGDGPRDNAEAITLTPSRVESPRLGVSNSEMATFQNPQGKLGTTPVAEREQAMFGNGFSFDQAASPYGPNDVIAQGFKFPNPVDAYKKEVEHHYRGRELQTMNKEIPAKAWDDAYKAFPELNQLGEKASTRLMRAIIANELEHYGPEDLAQDAVAKTGHGGAVRNFSLGYEQIKPEGLRNMARQMDAEMKAHQRESNPLARFEHMNNDQLAKEVANPANAPLLVAAHMALDLHMLNNHKQELRVTPEALGYIYNADMVYAKIDTKHEHLLTKKDADCKGIPNVPALPTEEVLKRSEHAANIRKWLEKVH